MVLDPHGWTDHPFLKLLVGKAESSTSAYNYLLFVAGLRGCLDTALARGQSFGNQAGSFGTISLVSHTGP